MCVNKYFAIIQIKLGKNGDKHEAVDTDYAATGVAVSFPAGKSKKNVVPCPTVRSTEMQPVLRNRGRGPGEAGWPMDVSGAARSPPGPLS